MQSVCLLVRQTISQNPKSPSPLPISLTYEPCNDLNGSPKTRDDHDSFINSLLEASQATPNKYLNGELEFLIKINTTQKYNWKNLIYAEGVSGVEVESLADKTWFIIKSDFTDSNAFCRFRNG